MNQDDCNLNVNILNMIEAYIYVSDTKTGELLFVNDKMRKGFGLAEDPVGKVCWRVLQTDMIDRCGFCAVPKLLKNPGEAIAWEGQNTRNGKYYRNIDQLIKWHDGRTVHLQHFYDISEKIAADEALQKRIRQQELMAAISQSFVQEDTPQYTHQQIHNAIRTTGDFLAVNQVALYKYDPKSETLTCATEWHDTPGNAYASVGYRAHFAAGEPWSTELFANRALAITDLHALSDDPFDYARNHGVQSMMAAPIIISDNMWGLLIFYTMTAKRDWDESDRHMGTLLAYVLSNVLKSLDMKKELLLKSALIQHSKSLISYVSDSYKHVYINPAVSEITGYSHEELMEYGPSILYTDETNAKIRSEVIPETLARGQYDAEIPLISKDGHHLVMSFNCFSLGSDYNGCGAIANDVTERIRMEADLRSAKEAADAASKAKGEFLSRMSHEMRTPLNAIIGMTSIALDAEDIARKNYCLNKIESASHHLLGVINDILDMSKIEAGKFEITCAEFSLQETVEKIRNVIGYQVEQKNQNLRIELSPALPRCVVGDEMHLSQVITNLLANAVKFTPETGDISLSIRLEGHRPEPGEPFSLSVSVRDNGIGISEEQQKRLFNSFEQADGSISRKYGGTGLGLAISKRIIEMMGGQIAVHSSPDEGSVFEFDVILIASETSEEQPSDTASGNIAFRENLPSATPRSQDSTRLSSVFTKEVWKSPQARARSPHPIAEKLPDRATLKTIDNRAEFLNAHVLLAEDVDINREIVAAFLEDTGIVLEFAENGSRAIKLFTENPEKYDLILMDIQMPVTNGLEATRQIRDSGAPNAMDLPIVAMTANVFRQDIELCLDAGMNDHIGKPIDKAELFSKLRTYLRRPCERT